jgi:membrane protease YdiL (CAAX protease family)
MISRIIRSIANPEAAAPPWSLGTAIVTVLVAVVAFIAGTFFTLNLLGANPIAPILGWSLGGVVTTVYVWLSRRGQREALRLGPANARLFITLLFGLGIAMLIDVVMLGISRSYPLAPELLSLLYTDAGVVGWIVAALFMIAIQPAAEELVFRGVLFPTLRSAFGGSLGWLLSALAYAGFHLLIYTSNPGDVWFTLVTPLLAGLFIGGVRAHTRSTWAAIAAHMGFGIFALLKCSS